MTNLLTSFILTLLLISSSYAFKVDIQSLNGSYTSPRGNGEADKFIVEGVNQSNEIQEKGIVPLTFLKINKRIDVTFGNQFFSWENPPQFLLNAETMAIQKFNTKTYSQVIQSSLEKADFDSKTDFFTLRSLSLFCQNPGRVKPTPADFLINACTSQAKIHVRAIKYLDKTGNNILTQLLKKVIPDSGDGINNIDVTSLKLNVNKHQFNFSTQVSYKLRTKINAGGASWYDLKTKILKIRLDYAKVSFFNITGKVFQELEKVQDENLTVERPYIYLKNRN